MEVKYRASKGFHRKTKTYIREVMAKLNETGAVEMVDIGALEALFSSYDKFVKADEELDKNGMVVVNRFNEEKPSPYVSIREKNYNQAVQMMRELGLTIKARHQIPSTQSEDDDDPLSSFVRSRSK